MHLFFKDSEIFGKKNDSIRIGRFLSMASFFFLFVTATQSLTKFSLHMNPYKRDYLRS